MTDGRAGVPRDHRPFRPTPGEPVRWPDDWGTRFSVFVDVEEEFDWDAPLDRAQRSTTAMRAFPEAHQRFADIGVGLTCMVDYPIVTDPASVDMLQGVAADRRCAIGTQLHSWVNPPHVEEVTPFTSFPGNLPPAVQAEKIATLTGAIQHAFGTRPLAFRAGRYGLGPDTLRLLAEAGYRIDSSVRPGYDYSPQGGPDYTLAGNAAWRAEGLVEVPLTTVFTGRLHRGGGGLHRLLGQLPKGRAVFARAGLLSRVALTPEDMPIEAAIEAVNVAVGEGLRLLTFSFHSPSLAPGHTPYVRDAAGLRAFWGWWEKVFARLTTLGVRHASLEELLATAG